MAGEIAAVVAINKAASLTEVFKKPSLKFWTNDRRAAGANDEPVFAIKSVARDPSLQKTCFEIVSAHAGKLNWQLEIAK